MLKDLSFSFDKQKITLISAIVDAFWVILIMIRDPGCILCKIHVISGNTAGRLKGIGTALHK